MFKDGGIRTNSIFFLIIFVDLKFREKNQEKQPQGRECSEVLAQPTPLNLLTTSHLLQNRQEPGAEEDKTEYYLLST